MRKKAPRPARPAMVDITILWPLGSHSQSVEHGLKRTLWRCLHFLNNTSDTQINILQRHRLWKHNIQIVLLIRHFFFFSYISKHCISDPFINNTFALQRTYPCVCVLCIWFSISFSFNSNVSRYTLHKIYIYSIQSKQCLSFFFALPFTIYSSERFFSHPILFYIFEQSTITRNPHLLKRQYICCIAYGQNTTIHNIQLSQLVRVFFVQLELQICVKLCAQRLTKNRCELNSSKSIFVSLDFSYL